MSFDINPTDTPNLWAMIADTIRTKARRHSATTVDAAGEVTVTFDDVQFSTAPDGESSGSELELISFLIGHGWIVGSDLRNTLADDLDDAEDHPAEWLDYFLEQMRR